jgi:hypothetical protein
MFIQIQTGTAAIIDLNLRRRQFQPETGIAVSQFHCQTGIAARSLSRVSHRHPSGPSHLSFQTGIARAPSQFSDRLRSNCQ